MINYVKCIRKYGNAEVDKIYNTNKRGEAKKLFSLTWEEVLYTFEHLNKCFVETTEQEYNKQEGITPPKLNIKTKQMRKFKNTFGVKGTTALIKAFAVEAELLGWRFDSQNKSKADIGVDPSNLWFCASDNKTLNLRPGHYWPDVATGAQYTLPQDWEEALKVASEIVEEIPEYVECIKNSMRIFNVTVSKIYKVIRLDRDILHITDDINNVIDIPRVLQGYDSTHTDFKPSTKEAFDLQNIPKLIEGEYYVNKNKKDPWTIFIVKSVEGRNISTYAYLNTEVNEFFNPFTTTIYENAPRLATSEERQWLDACVKAGKYLTKEEALKPKFKVGDWVKRTWKNGDVDTFKIERIDKTHYRYSHYTRKPYVELLCEGSCQISDDRFTDKLIIAPKLVSNETILTLGTSKIKITVYKDGKVEAEGKEGNIKMVKQLIVQMESTTPFIVGWDSTYTTIKIGCSTFTLDELKQIVTAHDKLNELEW